MKPVFYTISVIFVFILLLTFLFLLLDKRAESALTSTQPLSKLESLKSKCLQLSHNDADGRVFEPLTGMYLASKTVAALPPTIFNPTSNYNPPRIFSYEMIWSTRSGEIKVYSGARQDEYDDFVARLAAIIGPEAVYQKRDMKHVWGICVTKTNAEVYVGDVDSLTRMDH
ncbi:MAG: hypothetical protein H6858_09545 [Rhodospirillales bacterium]|nr:hypothetical protein [Alphaproteobacteria bacterium]MCB9977829.1 hypothetical protein [Rhodospirillales bacterium]